MAGHGAWIARSALRCAPGRCLPRCPGRLLSGLFPPLRLALLGLLGLVPHEQLEQLRVAGHSLGAVRERPQVQEERRIPQV
jgi:hypothetical protein